MRERRADWSGTRRRHGVPERGGGSGPHHADAYAFAGPEGEAGWSACRSAQARRRAPVPCGWLQAAALAGWPARRPSARTCLLVEPEAAMLIHVDTIREEVWTPAIPARHPSRVGSGVLSSKRGRSALARGSAARHVAQGPPEEPPADAVFLLLVGAPARAARDRALALPRRDASRRSSGASSSTCWSRRAPTRGRARRARLAGVEPSVARGASPPRSTA